VTVVVVVALAAVPTAAAVPLKGWGSNDHGQLDNGIVNFQAQATPEHILGGVRAAGAGQTTASP